LPESLQKRWKPTISQWSQIMVGKLMLLTKIQPLTTIELFYLICLDGKMFFWLKIKHQLKILLSWIQDLRLIYSSVLQRLKRERLLSQFNQLKVILRPLMEPLMLITNKLSRFSVTINQEVFICMLWLQVLQLLPPLLLLFEFKTGLIEIY